MPVFRDQAVVLRNFSIGEADRIVVLLTREHGQVRLIAKGIRKTTSRFGARLDPLNHVDIQWHMSHGELGYVNQVETAAAYGPVAATDYAKWTVGQAMAETAEKLTDSEPATAQFLLLLAGLRALVENEHEPGLVCDAYLLRSMAYAGWGASFENCARCDSEGPHAWFSISNGGVLCDQHKVSGCTAPAAETLQLMGALLSGDWQTAEASVARHRSEATGIVNASLQWHLEREVKSLKHVDRQLKGTIRAF